jgi:hypothetical protein
LVRTCGSGLLGWFEVRVRVVERRVAGRGEPRYAGDQEAVRREDRENGEAEMADPRSRAEPDREPGDRDGHQGQQ